MVHARGAHTSPLVVIVLEVIIIIINKKHLHHQIVATTTLLLRIPFLTTNFYYQRHFCYYYHSYHQRCFPFPAQLLFSLLLIVCTFVHAVMFDIITILSIVSKVLDDSPKSYDAVSECKKLEPWCSCGFSDGETIYSLSCNRIKHPTSMPNFTHLDLRYLTSLDFSESYFGKTLTDGKPFDSLRITSKDVQFDLRKCGITSISESFTQVLGPSATMLKLSDNYLSNLPSLKRLSSLQTLDLSNNRFKNVPSNLCEASSLRAVNFAGNSFHADISEQIAPFSICPNLNKVYWDRNRQVDCSCDSLKHYMWSHSNGPPFVEKETSKFIRCHQNSQIEFTRNEMLISLNQMQICSVCNCTEYLISLSVPSVFPSVLLAVVLPLVLCSILA